MAVGRKQSSSGRTTNPHLAAEEGDQEQNGLACTVLSSTRTRRFYCGKQHRSHVSCLLQDHRHKRSTRQIKYRRNNKVRHSTVLKGMYPARPGKAGCSAQSVRNKDTLPTVHAISTSVSTVLVKVAFVTVVIPRKLRITTKLGWSKSQVITNTVRTGTVQVILVHTTCVSEAPVV
jgi:hypothetical protein